jgi:hypothetical protein
MHFIWTKDELVKLILDETNEGFPKMAARIRREHRRGKVSTEDVFKAVAIAVEKNQARGFQAKTYIIDQLDSPQDPETKDAAKIDVQTTILQEIRDLRAELDKLLSTEPKPEPRPEPRPVPKPVPTTMGSKVTAKKKWGRKK